MKSAPYTRVEFWSGIGLVVFFFFPWVTLGGLFSLNGYQVADALRQDAMKASQTSKQMAARVNTGSVRNGWMIEPAPTRADVEKQSTETKKAEVMATVVYLIPTLGLLCVFVELTNKKKRPLLLYLLAAATPFIALALELNEEGSGLFQSLSIGAFLTLVAALGCFGGALIVRKTPVPVSGSSQPTT